MKKLCAWMMILALLLCAACGRQPQTPETPDPPQQQEQQEPQEPQTPEVPETPETPDVPETPETPPAPEPPDVPETPPTPVTPEIPEPPVQPDPPGAVAMAAMPAAIPNAQKVSHFVPLEGSVAAFLVQEAEKTYIAIFDCVTATVLSELEVENHDNEAELAPYGTDDLYYYDGQRAWKVTVDEAWQLSAEEYNVADLLRMGDKQVSGRNGSILVDGQPVLQAQSSRDAYVLHSILDDHRLLYQVYGSSTSLQGTYGVYDHETGQRKLLTTLGQRVLGIWGDTMIVVRGGGPVYLEGWFDLTDYSFTAQDLEGVPLDTVLCSPDGTRLMASWTDGGGTHVKVLDVETFTELYSWTVDQSGYTFYPVDGNGLLVQLCAEGAVLYWKVEY